MNLLLQLDYSRLVYFNNLIELFTTLFYLINDLFYFHVALCTLFRVKCLEKVLILGQFLYLV